MNITISAKQIKDHLEFRKLVNSTPLENIQFINKYGTNEKIPKKSSSNLVGQQNASVELIINDVLGRLDKKHAGEIQSGRSA